MNKKLTVEEIKSKIEEIKKYASDDPEAAHSMEDYLYKKVLRAIADGNCKNVKLCANEVLKVQDLDFPRWYA